MFANNNPNFQEGHFHTMSPFIFMHNNYTNKMYDSIEHQSTFDSSSSMTQSSNSTSSTYATLSSIKSKNNSGKFMFFIFNQKNIFF
jgi:hypothetical protein